ncbi:MAG: sugar transferase [Nitrospirae bacterium]|nr:sugar transferase [Nitrospirota bacterium]
MARPSRILLILSDLLIAYIAYILAFTVRTQVDVPFFRGPLPDYLFAVLKHGWLAVGLVQIFSNYLLGLYDPPDRPGTSRLAESLLIACAINTLALTSYYFYRLEFKFPRSILVVYGLFDAFFLFSWRWLLFRIARLRKKRVALCGHGPLVTELLEDIRNNPWLGYDVIGVVSDEESPTPPTPAPPAIGHRRDLQALIRIHNLEEVIYVPDPHWTQSAVQTLKEVESSGARILVAPTLYEMILCEPTSQRIKDIPLIPVSTQGSAAASQSVKNIFDLILSLGLLALLSPAFLVCALLIKATSSGPAIYRQERVGKNGRRFTLYKLRTMVESAESATGPVFVDVDDPRVTRIGRILRRLRVDEIPQLVNILKGDMSFVGPRPERPDFVETFERKIPFYRERHRVKPGLTGLAQVNGYYHTTAENKLKYDLAYVYRHNLFLDMMILLETAKVVLTRKGV